MKVIADRTRTVELDEFLTRPLFAHLATLAVDGPRDSPVWFLWEESCVWIIGSDRTDSFPSRLRRDGRCAVGIVDFDRSRAPPTRGGLQRSAEGRPAVDVAASGARAVPVSSGGGI